MLEPGNGVRRESLKYRARSRTVGSCSGLDIDTLQPCTRLESVG
jgi:hypothetical protein